MSYLKYDKTGCTPFCLPGPDFCTKEICIQKIGVKNLCMPILLAENQQALH